MSVPIELQEFSFAVDLIVKLALIQAVALSLVWFLRRTSAAVKHLILSIAAISVLVLPAASLLIPQWNTGLLSYAGSPGVTISSVSPAEEPLEYTREDGTTETEAGTDERAAGTPADQSPAVQQGSIRPSGILVTIWIVGAAGVLAWLAVGVIYATWLGAQARNIEEGPLKELFAEVAKRTGLKRHVALLESDTVRVPAVHGFLRQKFILPAQAKEWPSDRLEAIFIHELAHIGRYDNLIQFLAKLTLCIYWFNPLVWIIERKLFLARECACDDLVIGKYVKAPDYAEHLMDASVELGTRPSPIWATAAMAEGTAFKDRILSILNPNISRSTPRSLHALTIVIAAIVFLLPIAALSAWDSPNDWRSESFGILSSRNGQPSDENRQSTPDSMARAITQAQNDDSSLNALLQALRVDDPGVREQAVSALGRLGDVRAVPYLLEVLNDPSADVREHVASALGSLGDGRAVEPLCQTLLADTNAGVREHAAMALGETRDSRALEALSAALNDPSDEVRWHAAEAIEKIRGQQREN